MNCRHLLLAIFSLSAFTAVAEPKPVPRVQALPLPRNEISFQRDGQELARFRFAKDQRRPFVYPINGPSGRSLTRMGHPHDPESHSHHNSVWLSHHMVNGSSFWDDRGGTIEHLRVLKIEDGDELAYVETENAWLNKDGKRVMIDRRRIGTRTVGNREWMLLIDVELRAQEGEVTLGQTAFGMLGVRMAKTIGVHDGGGQIRNSEGGVNEEACFRKPARWIDYSGPITANATEGIALFDHPKNPHHPVPFHCRNDGWMGASLTFPGELKVGSETPLRLRYALFVHGGAPEPAVIDEQWKAYSILPWIEFPVKK